MNFTQRFKAMFDIHSPSNVDFKKFVDYRVESKKKKSEEKEMATNKKNEEWVWVDGYKGTDRHMTCRGFQYDMHKHLDMPEGAEIKDCESGFHLCLTMKHVLYYYELGHGNRYFRVKALVRKSDLDEYNKDYASIPFGFGGITWNSNGGGLCFSAESTRDKLAAKSIIFTEELTHEEILEEGGIDTSEWTDDQKERVFVEGLSSIMDEIRREKEKLREESEIDQLVELGYSRPFAEYVVHNLDKFKVAFAAGSQSDLSMDMKCLMILH